LPRRAGVGRKPRVFHAAHSPRRTSRSRSIDVNVGRISYLGHRIRPALNQSGHSHGRFRRSTASSCVVSALHLSVGSKTSGLSGLRRQLLYAFSAKFPVQLNRENLRKDQGIAGSCQGILIARSRLRRNERSLRSYRGGTLARSVDARDRSRIPITGAC
jgi:hypothetical protein